VETGYQIKAFSKPLNESPSYPASQSHWTEGRKNQRDIQGLDFEPEMWAAACSRWNRPPRGGFGR